MRSKIHPTRISRLIASIATLAATLVPGLALAVSLGTGFTYQGRLQDNGQPANGTYDFVFTIYDTSGGDVPLVSGVLSDDVVVANGVFTVVVDFGLDVFNGDERWLGVSVRPGAETGDVTPLLPRHRLTAAPYALLAKRAATADVATKANDVAWASIKSIPVGPGIAIGAGNQLAVSYAGNGLAATAARSDHDHFGQGWLGAINGPGLLVQNTAANGVGLLGRNDAGTGFTPAAGTGVLGDSAADAGVTGFSSTGTGVLGRVFNGSANNDGIRGENASTAGRGTSGYATAATGVAIGVWGQSDSSGGVGVRGFASAATGTTYGGYFSNIAPGGAALYAAADKSGVASFNISNRNNTANALEVRTDGTGLAAKFTAGASTNKVPAVQVVHLGEGDGIAATAGGAGNAGNFKLLTDSGDNAAVNATGFGSARALQAASTSGEALRATSAGTAIVADGSGGTALSIEGGAFRVKGAGVGSGTAVFIHECTSDNTPPAAGNAITFINHPMCNGNPNAILFVTPRMANDTLNFVSTYEDLAIFYSTSQKKWALMNTSYLDELGDFDVGNRFNVMVVLP
ncbi:MAG: hypothetical protein DVB31_12635 [Verrucomicrobia bacterium]|nr:MAG: hypothetical protein DVB31_12635 [Verrucomicrobiota bacterium]